MLHLVIEDFKCISTKSPNELFHQFRKVVGLAIDKTAGALVMEQRLEKLKQQSSITFTADRLRTEERRVSESALEYVEIVTPSDVKDRSKRANITRTHKLTIREAQLDDLTNFLYRYLPSVEDIKEFISTYGFQTEMMALQDLDKQIHQEDLWPLLFLGLKHPENWRDIFKERLGALRNKVKVWGISHYQYCRGVDSDDSSYKKLFSSLEAAKEWMRKSKRPADSPTRDPLDDDSGDLQHTYFPNYGASVLTIEVEELKCESSSAYNTASQLADCPTIEIENVLRSVGLESSLIDNVKRSKAIEKSKHEVFVRTLIKILKFGIDEAKETLRENFELLRIEESLKLGVKRKRELENECDDVDIKLVNKVQNNFKSKPAKLVCAKALKDNDMNVKLAVNYLDDFKSENGFWSNSPAIAYASIGALFGSMLRQRMH